jgi:hypothetical protein
MCLSSNYYFFLKDAFGFSEYTNFISLVHAFSDIDLKTMWNCFLSENLQSNIFLQKKSVPTWYESFLCRG